MSAVWILMATLAGLLLMAGVAALIRGASRREQELTAAWQAAGERLGMTYSHGSFQDRRLDGTVDGHEVITRVETISTGQVTVQRTRVELSGMPPSLTLRSEGALDGVLDRLGATDQQIGATDFDAAVRLGGDAIATLAFLDAETRALVHTFVSHGGRLKKGELLLVRDEVVEQSETLVQLVRTTVALAERLTDGRPVAERLVHNALNDPLPEVRLANLRALLRHGPAERREDTARAALSDSDPHVALYAGTWLGLDTGEDAQRTSGAVSLSALSAEQGALSEVRRTPARHDQKTD